MKIPLCPHCKGTLVRGDGEDLYFYCAWDRCSKTYCWEPPAKYRIFFGDSRERIKEIAKTLKKSQFRGCTQHVSDDEFEKIVHLANGTCP